MKKKQYGKPHTESVCLAIEQLMITASPGVGGAYEPNDPIDSKRANCFDDEEDEKQKPIGSIII